MDGHADGQIDRQIDRLTDRQMDICLSVMQTASMPCIVSVSLARVVVIVLFYKLLR